jgi:hypothetical protein
VDDLAEGNHCTEIRSRRRTRAELWGSVPVDIRHRRAQYRRLIELAMSGRGGHHSNDEEKEDEPVHAVRDRT